MEPLHKELHESATYVLNLMKTDPAQAQEYYQKTILSNLTTLVGLLDDVVEHGTELSEASSVKKPFELCAIQQLEDLFWRLSA